MSEERLTKVEGDIVRLMRDLDDLRQDMATRDKSTRTAIANLTLIMEQAQKAVQALAESISGVVEP